jgi:hypothetical protein
MGGAGSSRDHGPWPVRSAGMGDRRGEGSALVNGLVDGADYETYVLPSTAARSTPSGTPGGASVSTRAPPADRAATTETAARTAASVAARPDGQAGGGSGGRHPPWRVLLARRRVAESDLS